MDPDQAAWTLSQVADGGRTRVHRGGKSDSRRCTLLGDSRARWANSHAVRCTKSACGRRPGNGCSHARGSCAGGRGDMYGADAVDFRDGAGPARGLEGPVRVNFKYGRLLPGFQTKAVDKSAFLAQCE